MDSNFLQFNIAIHLLNNWAHGIETSPKISVYLGHHDRPQCWVPNFFDCPSGKRHGWATFPWEFEALFHLIFVHCLHWLLPSSHYLFSHISCHHHTDATTVLLVTNGTKIEDIQSNGLAQYGTLLESSLVAWWLQILHSTLLLALQPWENNKNDKFLIWKCANSTSVSL